MTSRKQLLDWTTSLPGGPWYLQDELADMLGITKHALKRLEDRPDLAPTTVRNYGDVPVKLYDRAAYLRLQEHRKLPEGHQRRGVKSLWSPQERTERRKIADRARYYRSQQRRASAEGDFTAAARAEGEAERLQHLLDDQAHRRGVSGQGRVGLGQP